MEGVSDQRGAVSTMLARTPRHMPLSLYEAVSVPEAQTASGAPTTLPMRKTAMVQRV
jgi:hypothetical protein